MSTRFIAYIGILHTHALLRWVLLAIGTALLARMLHGARTQRPWSTADERLSVAFVGLLDLQLSLGLVMHLFLSPIVQGAWDAGMHATLQTPPLWFFSMVHPGLMLIGIVAAHVGRARSKRASTAAQRFAWQWRTTAIWWAAVFLAMPWPWMAYGRPFLRGVS